MGRVLIDNVDTDTTPSEEKMCSAAILTIHIQIVNTQVILNIFRLVSQ